MKYIAKQDFENGTWTHVDKGEVLILKGRYLYNKEGKCICGINSITYDYYIEAIKESQCKLVN